ncbi:MAG: hypothetical protein ABIP81_01695 [Terriglobales bacterium]
MTPRAGLCVSKCPRPAFSWTCLFNLILFLACFTPSAFASDPTNAILAPGSTQIQWVGTAVGGVNPAPQLGEESHDELCIGDGVNCDQFVLKLSGKPGDWAGKLVILQLNWQVTGVDYDFYVHKGSATGPVVARGTTGPSNAERDQLDPSVLLDPDPVTGVTEFHIHVIYFAAAAADQYHGRATVVAASGSLLPAPVDTGVAPRYQNHTPTQAQIAAGMTRNVQDEPNIDVNWHTGNVIFQALMQTLRVQFNDAACKQSPVCIFKDVTPPQARQSFDPILFTDRETGRTQLSHLLLNPLVGISAFTEDDGDTWIPSQGSGIGSGIDHQTIGGGPFHAPLTTGAGYKNAVYYCSQDIALANCALSVDGGLTYGPAVPIYDLRACEGLHGHIKVAPDGTAYVPNANCIGQQEPREQAVVVSEDNGTTWQVRTVPGSIAGAGSDPSVSIDNTGRVYLGYASGDKEPAVAISEDQGRTWQKIYDIGHTQGIKASVFPAAVAGDDGRAAIAFYGTTDSDPNSVPSNFRFNGTWHLYIAHTFDKGASWTTVNATPNDPIQRGGLHLGGGGSIHRNLLDFFDATIDAQGRVIVGYADGCLGTCVQAPTSSRGNSYVAYGTIARQTAGRRMLANFGSDNQTSPGVPRLTVTRNGGAATVSWSQSETGGAPITAYEVFRRSGDSAEQRIAALDGSAIQFVDVAADVNTAYTYRVAASNALGVSCGSNEYTANPVGSSCIRPGVLVVTDANGDQLGADATADMDIQSISIGEPYYEDGSQKVEFTMKVDSLAVLPPSRMWRIIWRYPDGPAGQTGFVGRYYVGMNTDSASAVSFEYGLQESLSLVVTDVAPVHRLGDADPESSFSPDGTIRIVVSTDKIGGAKAGDLVGGLLGRTFLVNQNLTLRSDSVADTASFADTYKLVGNQACAPRITEQCFEENTRAISYSSGWHTVTSSNASGNQYRYRNGNSANALSFTFSVANGATGALVYHYPTSAKGGTADVYIDGVKQGTINFKGAAGTDRDPVFGSSARYENLAAGEHRFELRNVQGGAFIDRFCLQSASFTSTPTSGPGSTSAAIRTLAPAQDLLQSVSVAAGTKNIAVVAQGPSDASLKLLLLDPAGSVLTTVSSTNGTVTLDAPVSAAGTYVVKVVNVGLTSVEVWTAVTPWGDQ